MRECLANRDDFVDSRGKGEVERRRAVCEIESITPAAMMPLNCVPRGASVFMVAMFILTVVCGSEFECIFGEATFLLKLLGCLC